MIIREISTKKLYDSVYYVLYDEYWLLDGIECVRKLKPAEFRYLLYDKEKEYIIEKDDIERDNK